MKESIPKVKAKTREELLERLRPQLAEVERNRQKLQEMQHLKKKVIFLLVGTFTVVLGAVAFSLSSLDPMGVVVLPWAVALILIIWLNKMKPEQEKEVSQSIGKAVMDAAHPEWTFMPDHYLGEENFNELNLSDSLSLMEGEHLTTGKYQDTTFHFSYYRPQLRRDENRAIKTKLVMVFDFHKETKGKTVIFPDEAQTLLGSWLGKKIQSVGWRQLELVYFEDPVFEKHFAVYSTDQIEARYVLTPVMMEGLVQLKERYDHYEFSFSFTGGKVCVVISGLPDYRSKLDRVITPDGALDHFYRPVEMAIDVIETMNLNTRIWAKE